MTDAAFSGDLDRVKELVLQGYDVDLEHSNGFVRRTPLDNAIENENLGVIRYLLENGTEVNRKSEFGTPLHHAIDIDAEEPNWYDEQGNMRPPSADITQLLFTFGADVNIRTDDAETPLGDAIQRQHTRAEKILREHGAITS